MLAGVRRIGEPVGSGTAAAAWFRDRLWVAYAATDGRLVVRSVDVLGDPSQGVRLATGFPCGGLTAATVWQQRLYVLFGTPGVQYELTWTSDGGTFAPPVPLPIGAGFTGLGGLAGHPGGLAVLWAENAGGQAHLLQSVDGTTFDDTELAFRVRPEPGLCFEPTTGRLLVAYGDRGGAPGTTLAGIDPSDPATVIGSVVLPTATPPSTSVVCATRYHNRAALHVAGPDAVGGGSGPIRARTVSADFSSVGGDEPFGPVAATVSLAFDGTRTWVAWTDDLSLDLWVGSYASTFDLPEELRARLGEECDPATCPVDPRLVCAATDEVRWVPAPARIANARRGDLIMTPGDGSGLIGTLLEQLEPRQYFDHMGIMVRDHDLVRHATMAHDRLNRRDPGRFMTGEFFGDRAPVDGFRPDVLTYGWPGTLTQTVGDAFFSGFNTWNPATNRPYNAQGDFFALNPTVTKLPLPPPGSSDEAWEAWGRQQRFADPEFPADEPFAIHNFPNVPAYRVETGQVIDPVVVKPAPAAEAADPRIRPVLHRVADAAEGLDGHYRFYSYTDARVALDPAKFGPAGTWAAATRPVVCSSFVWAAIQLANARQPRIEVEGPATEVPDEILATPSVDGLYRYLGDEREKAGRALHELVSERVKNEVYLALQQAEHENRLVIDLASIGLTALVAALAGPVAAVAVLLGVTPSTIASLKLLIEDMPDDVATQLCNAFAVDRADETDDDLWESPGEGLAVSPDDIKNFWDAPARASNVEWWHGLYGTTERLLLTHGREEPTRVHRLDRSDGPAFVRGEVHYRGEPVDGARVEFGCDATMTTTTGRDHGPSYRLDLSAGRYEAVASAYWPATQELLTGRRVVDVVAGDQPGPVHIDLEDPPEWRRLVRCTGKIDTVRRVFIGSDDWAHSAINQQQPLTLAPTTWGEPPPSASAQTWKLWAVGDHAQRFNVRLDLTVTLQDDLSVEVKAASALCEHYYEAVKPPTAEQVVTRRDAQPVTIPAGGSHRFTFDHNSGNAPPDRGHVEVTVENLRAPA